MPPRLNIVSTATVIPGMGVFVTASVIALCTFPLPRVHAQEITPLEFDVATIKPAKPNSRGTSTHVSNGNLKATNITLKRLVAMSHNLREDQVLAGPAWVGAERFDIQAKFEPAVTSSNPGALLSERSQERQRQFEQRLQALLAERFQLNVKTETREMPVFLLVLAKGGAKLMPAKDEQNQGVHVQRGTLTATGCDMTAIVRVLADETGTPVLDRTGLQGRFDLKLNWTPEPPPTAAAPGTQPVAANPLDLSGPSLFTALQQQLGLKLESQKAAVPVLVIERAMKPSAN